MINKNTLLPACITLILLMGPAMAQPIQADNEYGSFQKDQSRLGLDVYKHIYDNLDAMIEQKAIQRALEEINKDSSIHYDQEDIEKLLHNDTGGVMDKILSSQKDARKTISNEKLLREIFPKILREYEDQKQMAEYETELQIETGAMGMYSNGSLDDSDYDIVVDLNKIDVILFGEKAKLPVAYWATYKGNISSSSSDQGTTASSSLAVAPPSLIPASSPSTNEEIPSSCPDNRTFPFPDPRWQEIVTQQVKDAKQEETSQPQGESNNNQNLNANANNNLNTNGNGDGQNVADSGYTSQKDEEGGKNWPCTSFFCIKISMEKGGQSTYPKSDNSIQAHAEAIYDTLKTINSYPVHLRSTTRGFFSLGSIAADFADKLHLKVEIIQKPVWTPKPHIYSSNDQDQIAVDVESAINKAQNRDPITGEKNAECADTAALSFTTGRVTAEEQISKQTLCQTEIKELEKMEEDYNKMVARSKNISSDMVPWERETELMLGHIKSLMASMQEFLKTSKQYNTDKIIRDR